MSLGSLLIQPQRIQRPLPDPWVATAQDMIKLTLILVEDANAGGPLAARLPALVENLEQRLNAQVRQGFSKALQRVQRHAQGMVRFVDDFNRDSTTISNGDDVLNLFKSLVTRLRSLTSGVTEDKIHQQLDIFRAIIEEDFGLGTAFITQQLRAMLDDLITAWQGLPSHISAKARRRRTLAIETLKRLKRQLNQDIDIDLFNTRPIARELYLTLQNLQSEGVFQQIDCYLRKIEEVLDTVTDISEVMPALSAGSTVGSQFHWIDISDPYCWYPSFLLSSQSLPLLALTDVKNADQFLTLFRVRNSGDTRVDALANQIYNRMPSWLREQIDTPATGDAAKNLLTELVGHINHLMMTGTLNENRHINTPLVNLTVRDAQNANQIQRSGQLINGEFQLENINLEAFENGPLLATVSATDIGGGNREQHRRHVVSYGTGELAVLIQQDFMAPFGDDYFFYIGGVRLPPGQDVFVVVTDADGNALPVLQGILDEERAYRSRLVSWMGLKPGPLTVTTLVPNANGVIVVNTQEPEYVNHVAELTLTLGINDNQIGAIQGTTQNVAAGAQVTLALTDVRGTNLPLGTVAVAANGSFSLADIDLAPLANGPVLATASVTDNHGLLLTNGARANLRRTPATFTVQVEVNNDTGRATVTGNLSEVPSGRRIILRLVSAVGNETPDNHQTATIALPLLSTFTNSSGDFQGVFHDLRGLPSGDILVHAWTLDSFGEPLTANATGQFQAPLNAIAFSVTTDDYAQATVNGSVTNLPIQESPHPFSIINNTVVELSEDLTKLHGKIPDGKLFYYNRRLLEYILGDRIEEYKDNCGRKILNYIAKKVEWKKHSVYIKKDRNGRLRYVMCDKMPIYIHPLGESGDAQWHLSDLFFDDQTSRTPAVGSLHFTMDCLGPMGCEILTFTMMLTYDTLGPLFTTIDGFSPGHEGGEIANAIWDACHTTVKGATAKPYNGYKSMGAFGTWLNSSWIGPKALITILGSIQGHHSAATAGNQWWFWVTMVMGDFIRPTTHSTNLKLAKKILKFIVKGTVSVATYINARHTGSDDPDLPTIKPANYKIKDGVDDGIEFLFTWMMFLPYSPDYHSIGQWHRAGHWDQRVPFFLWWFLVSPAAGALSGLTASGIRMLISRTWNANHFGESAAWGALNMGAYFLFKEYAYVEGKTGLGISSGTHARTGNYTGYPAKGTSPYRLPYAEGTSLYMGQGNNGLFSHNTVSNINAETGAGQWQFYAFDFGHDHREMVHAMRAGEVWDMRETEEDNSTDRWNFITIRHLEDELNEAHDDPYGTGTPRVTYAIYGHGAQNGITNALGADIVTLRNASNPNHADWGRTPTRVLQGQAIMEADDTGTSFHSHLHVYVVLEQDGTVIVNDPDTDEPVSVPPGPHTDSIPLVFYDVKDKYDGVPKFLTWHESKNEVPE